ncbi:hypothetical protein [Mycobacterium lepromatosis]|uniref:hypothetical protein n=1 Tax=Mycobacterium lepromatosis TaxID=480418 RepID=UPI001F1AE48F|nr:hypothetical protein [Mycobacterium lepromatosis]
MHIAVDATVSSMTSEAARTSASHNLSLWFGGRITGVKALDWVRAQRTDTGRFVRCGVELMRTEVLDTRTRILYVNRRSEYLIQLLARCH